jgi:hypothetical protein
MCCCPTDCILVYNRNKGMVEGGDDETNYTIGFDATLKLLQYDQ